VPEVLTTNAIITCPHGGLGKTIPNEPIWTVNGGFVLVENDAGDLIGCTSSLNCKSYVLKSMGLNATLIRGKKVILVTDFNQSITGLPLIMSELHEVVDKSSPVPLVDGRPPPQLPPAMEDEIDPVIASSMPGLAFSLSAPAPQSVTFTLTSPHPMKWLLILVNEPEVSKVDLTSTTPTGVTVSPLGGSWNSSPLAINMTLDPSFLQTLLVGEHFFYMTGVNQRGLSGTFVLLLSVTP
jgi:hypothetical protein